MQVLQYMGDRQSRAPLAELGRALLAAALADALVRDELFCQVCRSVESSNLSGLPPSALQR